MLNALMVIGLGVLILSILSFSASWPVQLLSILICILIFKILSLEKQLTSLQQKINEFLRDKIAPEKPPAAQPVKTEAVEVKQPVGEYVWNNESQVVETPVVQQEQYSVPFKDAKPITVTPQRAQDDVIVKWVRENLFSGNPMAKIGVLILFFGMAFLIKYVAQHNLFPVEFRLLAVGLTGLLMVVLGLRLSASRKNYASILSGGGIGLMYLTVFSAFQIYHLMAPGPAFVLLLLIVALSGMLAIAQDAKLLAVFGILGGFLAPILIANGSNNYILLFSYYLVLNIAILGIALFKSWRELNLIGFIFTFIISALWGWQSYQPEYFNTTEPFLICFFLFYVAIVIIYSLRQPEDSKGMVDTVLTFGNPFIVFGLQVGLLVQHYHFGLAHYAIAWSTFALSLFYGVLAGIIYLSRMRSLRDLAAAFVGIAILFATITIPLAFTSLWTATDWALESIVLLQFGIRQRNDMTRLAAGFIMLLSTVMFILNCALASHGTVFFSEYYLSGIFIVIASMSCSYLFYRCSSNDDFESFFAKIFVIVGCAGWYYLNLDQINTYASYQLQYIYFIIFVATSSMAFWLLGVSLKWNWLRYPAIALLPAMVVLSLPSNPWPYYHPVGITITWLYSFAVLYAILYLHEMVPKTYLTTVHLLSFLFSTWFIADRIDLLIMHNSSWQEIWRYTDWGLVPAAMLYLTTWGKSLLRWPLAKYEYSYQQAGGLSLLCFLLFWFVLTCRLPGDVANLYYLPLLNPLDLTIAVVFIAMAVWLYGAHAWMEKTFPDYSMQRALSICSILLFMWLNAVLLRTLHHWLVIPYTWYDLWNSMAVQASLSIYWTVIALAVTFVAARLNSRELWFFGYALIWVVIVKLFLVDLSDTNTLERIITFIGVGILLLINGYISPLPPKGNKKINQS